MKVKNNKVSADTWAGQQIQASAEYSIESVELHKWQSSDKVTTDITSGDLSIGDDNGWKSGASASIAFLMGTDTTPKDSTGRPIVINGPFSDAGGFRARFTGNSGTATKNTTTNIDYKLTEDRYINGVRLLADKHVDGDYVDFQVVDVDNILGYGAGVVLDEFGSNWYMDASVCTQPDVVVPYPAKVLKDLYIRVVYHSTGTVDDVELKANMYLHKKA